MYLDKLVISGFKSFVKKTTFEFKHPFVAIVGPNGGGKTNVVDALRWVMGEQSPKLLRLKKAEDAIFAGSKKLARLGAAQVDLHLNNHDNRLKIDYPEVVITRKCYRNGESEYFINKNKARLSDIIMLLAKANFGQKSYGVIGQGMITDILNANPQDRKDFFDEATGVKEFQIKRDQAINKLIRTEDNLTRAEDLLLEIEPRLRSLSRQVHKLEKRKSIEVQLLELQIKFYGSMREELAQKQKLTQKSKEEYNKERALVEKNIKDIQNLLDEISSQESRTALYQRMQRDYNDHLNEKNKLLKDQIVLRGKLEVEQEKQGELNLVWLQRKYEEVQHNVKRTNLEVEHLKSIIKQLEEKLEVKFLDEKKINKDFKNLEYELLKAKELLQKKLEVLSVPEIRERLVDIFAGQENFLKRLLDTTDLNTFKVVQKEAKMITGQMASLLDELHGRNNEEIIAQKKRIEILTRELSRKAEQKEEILKALSDLRINIEGKKEKALLLEENIRKEEAAALDLDKEIKNIEQSQKQKYDKNAQLAQFQEKNKKINASLLTLEEKMMKVSDKINKFNEEEEFKKQELLKLQNQSKDAQNQLSGLVSQINFLDIELAKIETKLEDLDKEIAKEVPLEKVQEINKWTGQVKNRSEISMQIENFKHQLELIGSIDQETVNEYNTTKERFDFLKTQSKDMRATIEQLDKIIDDLDITIKKQFNKSFKAIAENFEKYFKVLFGGGNAKLQLITEEPAKEEEKPLNGQPEPVEENKKLEPVSLGKLKKKQRIISGIDIEAAPPGKKVHNVHALSGGEKSMTAISLICAIIAANTPPFLVMDEVEAALDEANAEKFAAIVRKLAKKTQFIVITHNRATMHHADILYGVTMGVTGASNILSVKLEEAQKMTQGKEVSV
ncbi:MAG: AAA family ATPase [Patescibacteria group bacterium]|jgi:chromosome segregation protein